MLKWRSTLLCVVLCGSVAIGADASMAATPKAAAPTSTTIHRGGALTVLESGTTAGVWPELDPATNTSDLIDSSEMNAIFGQLFEQGPKGQIIFDMATGYKFVNSTTLDIYLRHGIKFTDGTPLDAQVAQWNISRDLAPANACICDANFAAVSSVSTQGTYTVVLNLSVPDSPIIAAFISEAPNWMASPTALGKVGETAFGQHPVGAGPFSVVSMTPNTSISLTKNPTYWQKGQPYLSSLTFQAISSDQSAYEALLSGQAQVSGLSTTSIIETAKTQPGLKAVAAASFAIDTLQFNTRDAPLNNILVREALYYATDAKPLDQAVYDNLNVLTESPSGPAGLFHELKVPGYRSYNPTKARALVQQLGGITINLGTGSTAVTLTEGVASEWEAVGIKVNLSVLTLPQIIAAYGDGNWQVLEEGSIGGYDPGAALPQRYASTGSLSGTSDPLLDSELAQAGATASPAKRQILYDRVYKRISDQAYSPFLFTAQGFTVITSNVEGIRPNVPIEWENVGLK